MTTGVVISATPELEASEPALHDTLQRFEDRLNALQPEEMEAVLEAATRALSRDEKPEPAIITALTGGRQFTPAERVEGEINVLMRSFARRRELLAGAMTASQVAKLLGTSRQTPHDRLASGTLLAVMDQGAWRFPIWQFDPDGDNGVIAGLPEVLRALDVSPLAKVGWLTRPNPILDGDTPLSRIKAGQVERVVTLARAVGVD
jgi:hypothetical protein